MAPTGLTPLHAVYVGLWLFYAYCFAGVIVEMLYCWIVEYKGVVESRSGLLYLPFNVLYGVGGVVITFVLVPVFHDPLAVFALGLVTGTVIEYLTSLIMDKVFHVTYWDYSDEFLNVQGRICLKYSIFWGLLSLLLLYVLDVFNVRIIDRIPLAVGVPALSLVTVATLLSIVLTLLAYRRFDQKNAFLRTKQHDSSATLPTSWWGRLVDRLVPDSVFINTFPRASISTEYQQLSGEDRRVVVWRPSIGRPNADRSAAHRRADEQAVRLSARSQKA